MFENVSNYDQICNIPQYLEIGFKIFQVSSFIVSPIYSIAIYLLVYHSGIHAKRIRIIYLRNLALNVLSMVTISIILCPIFHLPMIGYQSNGLIRFIPFNMAFPAILTVYCLLGVVISIMDLFHYRLKAISSMNISHRNAQIRRFLQRLVYLTYFVLVFTAISYLGLLTVQSSQPSIKPMIYEKYHMSEVWCPKFIVSDPYSWPIILAICTTFIFIVCVSSVVLLCGAFTLVILLASRKDLSEYTLKVQKRFTSILIVQAAVHVVFILGPIITIVVSVYFDVYFNDGGLIFFFVEAHQGTASTFVFIFTHSVAKKSFNYVSNRVRRLFGLQASNSIWSMSKVESRSKSVV
uniref:G_PROTEIN_RECEP_F1_2 domain-containing protein n=2 Tax=Caenorhabditis tropicalis TaxID=1561998 RepID=A0A1I7T554_9PELO